MGIVALAAIRRPAGRRCCAAGRHCAPAVEGGDGTDTLFGNSGDDALRGGAGTDEATGGAGEDIFVFKTGDLIDVDEVSGNWDVKIAHEDLITDFVIGEDKIDFSEFDGVETISDLGAHKYSQDGNMYFQLVVKDTNERVLVDVADGTEWSEFRNATNFIFTKAHGSGSNDRLDGSANDDVLDGGDGDDTLFGYGGDDTLRGGTGRDEVTGGAGNDVFVFKTGDLQDIDDTYGLGMSWMDRVARMGVIRDFTIGEDRIDFSEFDGVDSRSDLRAYKTDIDGNEHFQLIVRDTNERVVVDVADGTSWSDFMDTDNFIF